MGNAVTPVPTNLVSQAALVDIDFQATSRIAWAFIPHEQSVPNMTVRVDSGAIFDGSTLTEISGQNSPLISAPSANPRIDRVVVNRASGAVSVVTGAEAPSPVPPAIPAGEVPVAQVALTPASLVITNSMITDERVLNLLGLGSMATQNAANVAITGGSITGITDLAIADGGTGASTAAGARTNLGLGSIATQDANNVTITGGSISGIAPLAVADGGTGANTAAGARTNLGLGSAATQNSGDFLQTANNLSDLSNATTARTNLGLGSIATQDANNVTITGGSISGITDLAVADGGTGASTAAGARTNLGLGTIATQDANNVTISGGSIAGITPLAVADGGTGANNAATARTNLGLGSAATQNVNAFLQTANNLSDLSNATSARSNLGLGSMATQNANSVAITGGTATGLSSLSAVFTNASDALQLSLNDSGAAAGPGFRTYRNSASPVASDSLGIWYQQGNNSSGSPTDYASAYATIDDPTNGSEDASWHWQTRVAGTLTYLMNLGAGLYMDGATGGDPGAGKINATGILINGVDLQTTTGAPAADFKALKIIYNAANPNTAVDLSCAAIVVENASGNTIRGQNISVTVALNTTGANGLDSGSMAASTWYSLWIVSNGSTFAGLASTSSTSPTLPSGYTYKARIGWVRTNASSNLLRIIQYGRRAQYVAGTNPGTLPLMISGINGNIFTPGWATVSVSNFVPPTTSVIRLSLAGLSTASNVALVAPNNSYSGWQTTTNPPPLTIGGPFTSVGEITLESTNIYVATQLNTYVFCLGWEDNI